MNTASSWISVATTGLLACALPATAARAGVEASGPSGFLLRIETPVASEPTRVYDRFFQIGQWWSDGHTYSGKASNMTLDRVPGGCFCETMPDGGFIRHAALEYASPGKVARLSGALGPLQQLGAYGMLTVEFQADGPTRTNIVMTYAVTGFPQGKGFGELAPLVGEVMKEQFLRLKTYVETGKPTP